MAYSVENENEILKEYMEKCRKMELKIIDYKVEVSHIKSKYNKLITKNKNTKFKYDYIKFEIKENFQKDKYVKTNEIKNYNYNYVHSSILVRLPYNQPKVPWYNKDFMNNTPLQISSSKSTYSDKTNINIENTTIKELKYQTDRKNNKNHKYNETEIDFNLNKNLEYSKNSAFDNIKNNYKQNNKENDIINNSSLDQDIENLYIELNGSLISDKYNNSIFTFKHELEEIKNVNIKNEIIISENIKNDYINYDYNNYNNNDFYNINKDLIINENSKKSMNFSSIVSKIEEDYKTKNVNKIDNHDYLINNNLNFESELMNYKNYINEIDSFKYDMAPKVCEIGTNYSNNSNTTNCTNASSANEELDKISDKHRELNGDIKNILEGTRKLMSDLNTTFAWKNYINLNNHGKKKQDNILKDIDTNMRKYDHQINFLKSYDFGINGNNYDQKTKKYEFYTEDQLNLNNSKFDKIINDRLSISLSVNNSSEFTLKENSNYDNNDIQTILSVK